MQDNRFLKIESGCVKQVTETLKSKNVEGSILYVSDPIVDKLYGDIVKKQIDEVGDLEEESVDYNTISYAMELAERIISTDIKCIVGLGGGKVLDVCKYAAYVSKTPFLSIPTAMSNDGIASPVAVLKREDDLPKSLECEMPSMILLDTKIIENAPKDLIKAGIGDTISNYMALLDWEFACSKGKDVMNGYAYLMSKNSLDALMRTQYSSICPKFIELLANSLVLSGLAMDFSKSSRPVSGSEHLFSHSLDYYSKQKNLHGIQVALGTVAMLRIINRDYKELVDYMHRFGVEINPKKINIDKETFVMCMEKAPKIRENRYTYLHSLKLDKKYLESVYDELVEVL